MRTRPRYAQVRVPLTVFDEYTPPQIEALSGLVTQDQLQNFILSQLKRAIFGDVPARWNMPFDTHGIPSLSGIRAQVRGSRRAG